VYYFLRYIWSFIISTALLATLILVPSAHAATVTSANDYPTTLRTSQSANHQVLFTTSSVISEGATATLTFSTSFDTSNITEDDVDILDDGIELTTASSCAGTEKASVVMASDVLTITICAGDGGAITAGSQVTVEIGTNATSSGLGANRVVNPSLVGTYFVSIGGTFGDSGSIALPIGSQNDQISVSVAVPAISSGGGGVPQPGGGGTGDVTAPTISEIVVSSITINSATINWTTNESSDSVVEYGLTESLELGSVTSSSMVSSHSTALSGLSEWKTYYFRVTSKDASLNVATSATQTFSTLDQTAPVITAVSVVDITQSSARIAWTTNEVSTSLVDYGTTESYGLSRSNSALVTDHSVVLSALSAGKLYHFHVRSVDGSLNSSTSADGSFTTLVDLPPANVSGLTITASDKTLSLSWTNPSDSDLSGIRVLECFSAIPTGPNDVSCEQVQNSVGTSLARIGLTNGTTYYYGVFAYDTAGQFASGAVGSGIPTDSEEDLPSDKPKPIEDPKEDPTDGGGDDDTKPGTEPEPTSSGTGPSETTSKPTALGAQMAMLERSDLTIAVGDGSIILSQDEKGTVDVLPATRVRFTVPEDELSDHVETLQVSIGSDAYLMRLVDEQGGSALYSADVMTPNTPQLYGLDVTATYTNGTTESVSSLLNVMLLGIVFQNIDGEETPIEGVRVTLSSVNDGNQIVWDGSPYAQYNPVTTASNGTYGWYVLNGSYQVAASKQGYEAQTSGIIGVTNQMVNLRLAMSELPSEVSLAEPVKEFTETVKSVLQTPVQQTVADSLQTVRENVVVQGTADVLTPILAVAAGVSVLSLAFVFDFIPLLQYLFTAPILFFWRRKRKGYGVVYNAMSKTPVDLAMVRLFLIEDEANPTRGRLIQSRVTDRAGRFFFLIQPGKYRLVAQRAGFQFPTEYLSTQKDDGTYFDVYHGEIITVTEKDAVITPNIPLDPVQMDASQKSARVVWQGRLRVIQQIVALSGVILSLIVLIIRPNVLAVVMVIVQIAIYCFARRLAKPRKPKSWGIVYDKHTGRPLSNVIARIFEPRYNKLLDSQITDARGRYAFLLGPSEYFAVFEKEGYVSTQVRPIDLRDTRTAQDFSVDVQMEEKEKVASSK